MLKRITLGAALAAALAAPLGEAAAQERKGWIGISFGWESGSRDRATVEAVYPRSPARRAGLEDGDVILRIDGRAATEAEVDRLRERLEPGDSVRLRVIIEGREADRVLVAAARPATTELAARTFRIQPGEMGPMVFRMDSMGLRMDSVMRRTWRERGDSVFHFENDGRNVTIRLHADSIRAHADTLLRRMDSLRVQIHRTGPGREPVVLRFDTTFEGRRGTVYTRPRESIRELVPDAVWERGADELPFFMELGMRGLAGAEFTEMNAGLARYFGNTREGLLVLRVSPSTPASRAGLEAGDVVVKVGERAVESVRDLRAAVRDDQDRRIPVEVVRQGRRRTLELRWEGEEMGPFRSEFRREIIRTTAPAPRGTR